MSTIIVDYVRAGRVQEVTFKRSGDTWVAKNARHNETLNVATMVIGYDAPSGRREFNSANVLYYAVKS